MVKLKSLPDNLEAPERESVSESKTTIGENRKKQGRGDYVENEKMKIVIGEGFTATQAAELLGVVYVSSGNPNSKIVNQYVKKFKIKPAGLIETAYSHYDNGGFGGADYDTPLYSAEQIASMKSDIESQSKAVKDKKKKDVYEYRGEKFKVSLD